MINTHSYVEQQKNSFIGLTGDIADSLFLTRISGVEALSTPFQFQLHCKTLKQEDALSRWYGKAVAFRIGNKKKHNYQRYLHGVISQIRYRPLEKNKAECILTLEPSFALLNLSQVIRIWQNISVPDLVRKLLNSYQINKVNLQLHNNYPKREYCVQYRETTLDFIQRILAEEGIYYYFQHSETAHTLVLADNPNSHQTIQNQDLIYRPHSDVDEVNKINYWASCTSIILDKVEVQGINMPQATAIEAKQQVNSREKHLKSLSWFDVTAQGERAVISREAKNASVAREANSQFFIAETCAYWLATGETFNLKEHSAYQGKYRIQAQEVNASNAEEYDGKNFHSTLQVMENDRNWHPTYPEPHQINTILTGTVVGPSSEEIHTDEYGRIKVKFPWDKAYPNDDSCSCWMRVVQPWTGSKFGALFLPRVGSEVLVSFIHGNPEHPVVIGSVYNGKNKTPLPLPQQKNESGFFTRSTSKGKAEEGHRLSFNDKKDEELLTIVSQKDLSLKVKNDAKTTIAANRTTEISKGNDSFLLKEGNRTITLDKGNLATELKKGDLNYKVTGKVVTAVNSGDYSVKVNGGGALIKSSSTINIESSNGINLKVGSNTIKISNSGITINGVTVTVKGSAVAELKAPMAKVSGQGMTMISGTLIKIA